LHIAKFSIFKNQLILNHNTYIRKTIDQ